jgi:hypothetical protein
MLENISDSNFEVQRYAFLTKIGKIYFIDF